MLGLLVRGFFARLLPWHGRLGVLLWGRMRNRLPGSSLLSLLWLDNLGGACRWRRRILLVIRIGVCDRRSRYCRRGYQCPRRGYKTLSHQSNICYEAVTCPPLRLLCHRGSPDSGLNHQWRWRRW